MAIKGLLYIYILFVAVVSVFSFKRAIYLIWITVLLLPPIVLLTGIKLHLSFITILMLGAFVSEILFSKGFKHYKSFWVRHQRAILLYFIISISIAVFSQTVPVTYQLRRLFAEIAMLIFALQTFLLVKKEQNASKVLMWIVIGVVIFNVLYCGFFELYLGVNPAGEPLYLVLGIDDQEFLVDMIDQERGGLSLRAQTVYGHPLSLGQYMLVLLPIFMAGERTFGKFLVLLSMIMLTVLSGSRGAIAPIVLVTLLGLRFSFYRLIPKFLLLISALLLIMLIVPERNLNKLEKGMEPYVVGLMFWDDQKQRENDMGGSSMEMRFNQFDAALKEISANPVFGRGYGYREYWQNMHKGIHPDLMGYESVLVYYLVERGLIGLVFFFIMAFYMLKLFIQETTAKRFVKLIYLGWILSIVMTGVRPLTLLFVCFSSSLLCGLYPKKSKSIVRREGEIPFTYSPHLSI